MLVGCLLVALTLCRLRRALGGWAASGVLVGGLAVDCLVVWPALPVGAGW